MNSTIELIPGKCIVVKLPENINEPFIGERSSILVYFIGNGYDYIGLPKGNWQIHCTCGEVDEEKAAQLVEKGYHEGKFCGYPSYELERFYYAYALESFSSLLRSKDVVVEDHWLILINSDK